MKKRLVYLVFAVCFFHTLNVATATDFCSLFDTDDDGKKICKIMNIENNFSGTVRKVTITEYAGSNDRCRDDKKVHSGDLGSGDNFKALLDKGCKYKIRFKPTAGCEGDKDIKLDPGEVRKFSWVYIKGGCGSLKVVKDTEKF